MSDPSLIRIDDLRRAEAADLLREHYAVGRLTPAEYDERLTRILNAKTEAEITPLFADLPEDPRPSSTSWGNRLRRLWRLHRIGVLVASAVVLVGIVTLVVVLNRDPAPTPAPTVPVSSAESEETPVSSATDGMEGMRQACINSGGDWHHRTCTCPHDYELDWGTRRCVALEIPPVERPSSTAAPSSEPPSTVTVEPPVVTVTASTQTTTVDEGRTCPYEEPLKPAQLVHAGAACAMGEFEYCDCV